MQVFPYFADFSEKYYAGKPQLVWVSVPTDMETPVSAMLKLMQGSKYHLLFESVEGGETRARYSIIALDPDLIWRAVDGKPEINRNIDKDPDNFTRCGDDVMESLRSVIAESQIDIPANLPPMASGVFGYMGYDMVRFMEKLPSKNPDNIGIPESLYMRPKIVVIFDSVKDEAMIVTPAWPQKDVEAQDALSNAESRIEAAIKKMRSAVPVNTSAGDSNVGAASFKSHISEEEYCKIVEKAKEYIIAGDIFQVVPSRRWEGKFDLPPFALYRSLRHLNPSPYLFYVELGGFSLVGSSPEILVRLRDGIVTIRPIAGTRPRGKTAEEDKALEKDLLADGKELAEHLMLLDLGRNDVGRVAKPNTVRVTENMVIERYSHVMHIVSNVEGEIKPEIDALGALMAGFPAGTVSGAPKIRAMEIIDELEVEKRSFYGGTVGYFSANGSMDTCIALRTGLVKDGTLYVQAGGGVVADSKPKDEFIETQNKAGALISAAGSAAKFL